MCLAVPGKVLSIAGEDPLALRGQIDFSGVKKEVSLAFTPEVKVGEYVLVHVGFALSVVDEEEARKIFATLDEMDKLAEAGEPPR